MNLYLCLFMGFMSVCVWGAKDAPYLLRGSLSGPIKSRTQAVSVMHLILFHF